MDFLIPFQITFPTDINVITLTEDNPVVRKFVTLDEADGGKMTKFSHELQPDVTF